MNKTRFRDLDDGTGKNTMEINGSLCLVQQQGATSAVRSRCSRFLDLCITAARRISQDAARKWRKTIRLLHCFARTSRDGFTVYTRDAIPSRV